MTKENLKTIALIVLTSFLLWGYVRDDHTAKKDKSNEVTENIKLYSNGKLIGQWQGIGQGSFDGRSYTFKTSRGAYTRQFRIKGDFIIETEPN
ncbi:MAG TPA: hypothetical protein VJ964_11490 [Balneolaceae bacterium]|nr:hypothetical protein [Balneolaceae bacterium]